MNRLKNERNLFFEGGKHVINEIMTSSPVFFMGASSGAGFYSCFDDIYDADRGDRAFILKGQARNRQIHPDEAHSTEPLQKRGDV